MTRPSPRSGRTERIIAEPVIAAIAADAALRIPGVQRLEPGVAGLLRQFAGMARRLGGIANATRTEGVEVRVDGDTTTIQLSIVVSLRRQVAATAHAVQRAVTDAVVANTGIAAPVVALSIVDIDVTADVPGAR